MSNLETKSSAITIKLTNGNHDDLMRYGKITLLGHCGLASELVKIGLDVLRMAEKETKECGFGDFAVAFPNYHKFPYKRIIHEISISNDTVDNFVNLIIAQSKIAAMKVKKEENHEE